MNRPLAYLAALIGIKLTGMRMRAPAANGDIFWKHVI